MMVLMISDESAVYVCRTLGWVGWPDLPTLKGFSRDLSSPYQLTEVYSEDIGKKAKAVCFHFMFSFSMIQKFSNWQLHSYVISNILHVCVAKILYLIWNTYRICMYKICTTYVSKGHGLFLLGRKLLFPWNTTFPVNILCKNYCL